MTKYRKHEPIARTRGPLKVTRADGTVEYVKAARSQAQKAADAAARTAGRAKPDG